MNDGWITIQRQIMDWQWYTDPNTFRLFVHLLLKATHKPVRWRNVELLPGQLITGRKVLAEELQLSEREIRTAFTKLKTTNELSVKTTNKFSIVTVNRWITYQQFKQGERPTERPTNSQTNDHIQQLNKETRRERVKFTPPSLSEIESYFSVKIAEKGLILNPKTEAELFESHYGSKNWMVGKNKMVDWKKSVNGWIARKKVNEPPKPEIKLNINPSWQ